MWGIDAADGIVWWQSCSYLPVSMYGVGICDQFRIIICYYLTELYSSCWLVALGGIPFFKENMPRIV